MSLAFVPLLSDVKPMRFTMVLPHRTEEPTGCSL
jgi:hypothetical protein